MMCGPSGSELLEEEAVELLEAASLEAAELLELLELDELELVLLDEDAVDELLVLLELLAVLELLVLVELLAVLEPLGLVEVELEEVLDDVELLELGGAGGVPPQDDRIMAAIIAADAAVETIRSPVFFKRISISPFKNANPMRNSADPSFS